MLKSMSKQIYNLLNKYVKPGRENNKLGRDCSPINLNPDHTILRFISKVAINFNNEVFLFREPYKLLTQGHYYTGSNASLVNSPMEHSTLIG
jgi:hypothetical protein